MLLPQVLIREVIWESSQGLESPVILKFFPSFQDDTREEINAPQDSSDVQDENKRHLHQPFIKASPKKFQFKVGPFYILLLP